MFMFVDVARGRREGRRLMSKTGGEYSAVSGGGDEEEGNERAG